MTRKKPPEVDETDVNEIVAMLAPKQTDPHRMTAEERADLAHTFTLTYAKAQGKTSAWAKELARKVRKRILWIAPSN